MPFFSDNSSPFDDLVETATQEQQDTEKWDVIMDICDKVAARSRGSDNKAAKACLLSIKKRLNHRDPHVIMLALGVLDACMINAGVLFRREVCSREFMRELASKCTCSVHLVGEKTRNLIKKWSNAECKTDPSLSLVLDLYKQLKQDGWTFGDADEADKKKKSKHRSKAISLDPNAVDSKEEEDAIAKAIAESLKTATATSTTSNKSHAYPTSMKFEQEIHINSPAVNNEKHRVVKALYDFEAAEENELTFKAGELITVTDDADINWWRGSNARGEGLFPTSFVTADLAKNVMANAEDDASTRKVQFTDTVQIKEIEKSPSPLPPTTIDEALIDSCLAMLQDADPTGVMEDSGELLEKEKQCQFQTPLIDNELASIDRRHNALAEVDIKLRDTLALYDAAMAQAVKQLNITSQQQQPQQYAPPVGMPAYPAQQGQQPQMYYQQQQQQPQYLPQQPQQYYNPVVAPGQAPQPQVGGQPQTYYQPPPQ